MNVCPWAKTARKNAAVWLLAIGMSVAAAIPASAEIKPEEVAILAMSNSPQSRQLAEHYADVRHVPKSQILLLDGIPRVELSRVEWDTAVRPRILDWLKQNQWDTKIRCMVLSWDVPLKIGKRSDAAPEVLARKEFLTSSRAQFLQQVALSIAELQTVAKGEPASVSISKQAHYRELAEKLNAASHAAQDKIRQITQADQQRKTDSLFKRAIIEGAGLSVIVDSLLKQGGTVSPEQKRAVEVLGGEINGLKQGIGALAMLPDNVSRDIQLIALLQKTRGSLGVLQWIEEQQEELEQNESYASFESELSLLFRPDYPVLGWQPNWLHYEYDGLASRPATLMVSRLAAPRFELAMGLVDTAVEVEAMGLSGKVYLDARGMRYDPKNDRPGSYAQYDQSLRDLAERIKKHTKLEVVLDDRPELFAPGACPDAALYCGWYSLGEYIDSFTWRPGAVGYHLASMEAQTLTTPGSKVWCNAMLEHGVAATLGPVWEPHLLAFPLPDDFFSLLLTGRYNLVESYYRTTRYTSWVMVLVGDPLYNPFKEQPPLSANDLPDRLKPRSAASPTSTMPAQVPAVKP